ncbi:MAG TPA: hypothetical protein VF437_02325, partial [Verrucomicrobiae bacterium]
MKPNVLLATILLVLVGFGAGFLVGRHRATPSAPEKNSTAGAKNHLPTLPANTNSPADEKQPAKLSPTETVAALQSAMNEHPQWSLKGMDKVLQS